MNKQEPKVAFTSILYAAAIFVLSLINVAQEFDIEELEYRVVELQEQVDILWGEVDFMLPPVYGTDD